MNRRIWICFLALGVLAGSAQGDVSGYLSGEYRNGQEAGNFPEGSFVYPAFGLVFSGNISPQVGYAAEIRVEDGFRLAVEQAWVGLGTTEAFRIQFGVYLVPFGRYNRINRPHQTLLVLPPLPVEYSFPSRWRDIGFLIQGRSKNFFYSGYIGNGLQEYTQLNQTQPLQDNNGDKGKGGRLGVVLGQGVEAAYSVFTGKYDAEGLRSLTLHGADLSWTTEDWQVVGEYTRAKIGNPEGFSEGESEGFFIQMFLDFGNIRPVAAYQKHRYEDPYHGPGFSEEGGAGEGIAFRRTRWSLGLVYLLSPDVMFKLEYDFNREKPVERKDNLLAVQVAARF